MAVTDSQISALQTGKSISESVGSRGDGSLLIVAKPASKEFYYKYQVKGSRRKVKLGSYRRRDSTKAGLTLSSAREQAREFAAVVRAGNDPQVVMASKRAAAEQARVELHRKKDESSSGALLDFYTKKILNKKESQDHTDAAISRHIRKPFKELLSLPANQITAKHIQSILFRMSSRGITTTVNRVRGYICAAFNAGLKAEHDPRQEHCSAVFALTMNPVLAIPVISEWERTCDHYLSHDELVAMWDSLDGHGMSTSAMLLLKITILTGNRPTQLSRLTVNDVDLACGTIAIDNQKDKGRRLHILPITDPMREVLEQAIKLSRGGWLFPNKKGDKHITAKTMASVLERHIEARGLNKFVLRDLRRTFTTLSADVLDRETRNLIQGHAISGTDIKHYDRNQKLPIKLAGLDKYYRHIFKMQSNVIQLKTVNTY